MILHNAEVARRFPETLSFRLFPSQICFGKNMSGTKFIVQTLLFPTKKSLTGLEVGKIV